MKKILIINEYNSLNIGDQAIAFGMRNLIKDVLGDEVIVELLGLENCKLNKPVALAKDNLEQKEKNNLMKWLKSIRLFSRIHVVLWAVRYLFRIFNCRNEIKKSDVIIIGGGGIIMNNDFHFPIAIRFISSLCRFYGKSYGFSGVSIGGEINKTMIRFLSSSIKKASFFHVRDPISKKEIEEKFSRQVQLFSDFAFYGDYLFADHNENIKNKKVAVNISGYLAGYTRQECVEYKESMLKLIKFLTKDYNVILVSTGWPDDNIAIRELYDLLDPSEVEKCRCAFPVDLNEYIREINKVVCVIATRLHASIIATASLVPSIVIGTGKKQVGFVSGIGMSDFLLERHKINDIDCVLKMLNKISSENNDLLGVVNKQRKLCREAILNIGGAFYKR